MGEKERESGLAQHSRLNRTMEEIVGIYIVVVVLFHLLYISDLLVFLGSYTGFHWLIISEDAFRALHLSLMIPIIFLLVPAKKGTASTKLLYYNGVLIGLCLLIFGGRFLFWNDVAVSLDTGNTSFYQLIMGVIGTLIVFEVLRRTMGLGMVILTLIFFFYPLLTGLLPGFLFSRPISLTGAITELLLGYRQGGLSSLINIASQIVLPFVLLGILLGSSGAGRFYTNLILSLLGRLKSGPAQTAVWGSGLVGSLSAVPSANAAITGVITIPLMKSVGYPPRFAAAVEAVAASGGAIMPPVMSSAAFLMADFLGISYWQVCVAAFIPALIYYFSIAVMVYLEAGKRGIKPLSSQEIPSLKQNLKSGCQFFIPLIVLIFTLGILEYNPGKAALITMITLLVVSWFKKESRFTWQTLSVSFRDAARTSAPLSSLFYCAGILVAALSVTGLDFRMVYGLTQIAGGSSVVLLLLGAILCLILGMPLNPTAAYLVLALLLTPPLKTLGISPLATHMFIFYFAILGPITPPSCNCCFVAAAIAGEPGAGFAVGWRAMHLSIVLMILAFSFAYSPALLMQGNPLQIFLASITAFLGALSIGIGVVGWFLRKAGLLERILFLAAGICLLWPGWLNDIAGILIFGITGVFHFFKFRYANVIYSSSFDNPQ